tara:strand:- start:486 stop:1445 length:960 start_codon:yes stop_codon:yes gene_type:complete
MTIFTPIRKHAAPLTPARTIATHRRRASHGHNNYRKEKIVKTDDINKFISYLDKNKNDIYINFDSYFKDLFEFNIKIYESRHNFYQKFVELMYYSYNEIKKDKNEEYMVTDFYSDYYFVQQLIYKTFREQNNYHYNFLIHIITDIIDIIKDEYETSKSVSRSRSRSHSKQKLNWEKNNEYIDFIIQLLTIIEEEAVAETYIIETNIKLLLKLLYDFIIANAKTYVTLYNNNQNTINISNTHILICINELNNMDNKTHLQLKEQLNKNQSRGKNKTRRIIGGKKIKKTKKKIKKKSGFKPKAKKSGFKPKAKKSTRKKNN